MRTTLYLILITIVVSLTSSFPIDQKKEKENAREKQKNDSIRISGLKKETKEIPSLWLNKKYFPKLQDGPCPFYYTSNSGC